MSKNTLVFVSAKDCPACVSFSTHWPEIKKQLGCDVFEINLDKREHGHNINTKYGKNIQHLIGWYPTFMLFNTNNFASSNEPAKNALVFNGIVKGNSVSRFPDSKCLPINAEVLKEWVKTEIPDLSPISVSAEKNDTVLPPVVNKTEPKAFINSFNSERFVLVPKTNDDNR
jgi:hypothetical protein